jgi:hypothetical protein
LHGFQISFASVEQRHLMIPRPRRLPTISSELLFFPRACVLCIDESGCR